MGIHIAVEGLDGAGKSTLIDGLRRRFEYLPLELLALPDPRCICGNELIAIIKHHRSPPSAHALALAFAANRLDQYQMIIAPFLKSYPKGLAISHRYLLSGFVYQELQGVPGDWLREINRECPPADLTLFIETPPQVCAERMRQRPTDPELFEQRLEVAHDTFLRAAEESKKKGWSVAVLDGTLDPEGLIDDASKIVNNLLKRTRYLSPSRS